MYRLLSMVLLTTAFLYGQKPIVLADDADETSIEFPLEQNKHGEIMGTVIDAGSKHPLEGVTIKILGTEKMSVSKKDGQYTITEIPEGIYQVQATKEGYSEQTENNVRIAAEGKHTLFFGMKKDMEEMQQPVPIHYPTPKYPEIMRRAGIQGIIFLQLEVSEKGDVTSATVQQSRFSGPKGEQLSGESNDYRPLEESALKTAKEWKFKPAMKSGKPIKTFITLPIKFRLDSSKSSAKEKMK